MRVADASYQATFQTTIHQQQYFLAHLADTFHPA